MKEPIADLLLHPVRMRILLAMVHNQRLTPLELAALLPDVPQATLYRQINRLAAGGLLDVVEERPVRGTVEKVYQVVQPAPGSAEELLAASPADHLRWFTTYMASILGSFERYLSQEEYDLLRDGVGYWQVPLHLSPEELADFNAELRAVLQKAVATPPGPGRRRLTLSLIQMPEPSASEPETKE